MNKDEVNRFEFIKQISHGNTLKIVEMSHKYSCTVVRQKMRSGVKCLGEGRVGDKQTYLFIDRADA